MIHVGHSSSRLRRLATFVFVSIFVFANAQAEAAAPLTPLDEQKLVARGIRVLRGKHLELLTDVPSSPAIDELPAVFDAAVPQWRDVFGIPETATAGWRRRGYLMADRKVFEAAELLPADLPEFPNGYTYDGAIYLIEMKADYYRRHLLLHEGTHLFQFMHVRPQVDQWFSEGLAETLGTHRWKDGVLQLGIYPAASADVPSLGRIEILQADAKRGRTHPIAELSVWEPRNFARNEAYAWSWAAVATLQRHPRYRERFATLMKSAREADLNEKLQPFMPTLRDDLAIFAHDAVYGYDWDRNAVAYRDGREFPAGAERGRTTVAADRGWQSSGIRVEAGKRYDIAATGRALLRTQPQAWPTEPNGVTIRWHHGIPLGTLLAAVRAETEQPAASSDDINKDGNKEKSGDEADTPADSIGFAAPLAVGVEASFRAPRTGTLYFKIHDHPGELSDNSGSYNVEIAKAK